MMRRGDVTKNQTVKPERIWDAHSAKFPKNVQYKNEGLGQKDNSPITLPGIQKTPVKAYGNSDEGSP